jgi:hypothetical protein
MQSPPENQLWKDKDKLRVVEYTQNTGIHEALIPPCSLLVEAHILTSDLWPARAIIYNSLSNMHYESHETFQEANVEIHYGREIQT